MNLNKTLVDQHNNALVCICTNNSTCCLQHPIETLVLIGIGKSASRLVIKISLDQVPCQSEQA